MIGLNRGLETTERARSAIDHDMATTQHLQVVIELGYRLSPGCSLSMVVRLLPNMTIQLNALFA